MLVLPRLGSQRGVLVAVAATIVLAATLLATGPVLATAIAEAGLRSDLAQAAPADIGVEVEVRTTASRAAGATDAVLRVLDARFGESVASPDVRTTAGTVHLVGQPPEVVTPVAVTPSGTVQRDDAALLTPTTALEVSSDGLNVLVHADALPALGLAPGAQVRTDDGVVLHLGGAVAPVDPGDRRWWDDPLVRDGVVPGVDFTQVGPLFVPAASDLGTVLGEADPRVVVTVRTLPVLDEVNPAALDQLGRRARGLAEAVDRALDDGQADRVTVAVPLADATSSATVALAATRAAVVATVGQVGVLALYTLGLAGRLLRSGREVETMLVRARGATPRQLGRAALAEGLVLVVPAVLVAPWLAVLATRSLGGTAVVQGAGLLLVPRVSGASLVAALAAGVACLVVLVVPAVTSARRTYASTRGGRGRRSPVGVLQELGLDLALAAVAALGVWQLRAQGGPLGQLAPRGPGDVDPVLVAAPALALLAGALLVLRAVPALTRAGERLADRSRGVVAGLGGWQVARRPDAVARPTLLLVLAVAVGTLAATYEATWRTSQQEQAVTAVGADLLVDPDRKVTALPAERVASTIEGLDGVDRVRPSWEGPVSLVAAAPGGTLLGLSADDVLLRTRDDLAPSVAWSQLDVAPLGGLDLPAGDELRVPVSLTTTGTPPAAIELTLVLRDGHGLLHRLPDRVVPWNDRTTLDWDVAAVTPPVAVVAVDATVEAGDLGGADAAPAPPSFSLQVGEPRIDGDSVTVDGRWVADPFTSAAAFPPTLTRFMVGGGQGWWMTGTAGLAGARGRLATLRLVHEDAALVGEDAAPAVVHPDVLTATGRQVGDELVLGVSGSPLRLVVVGTVELVPGSVGVRQPVIVDLDAVVVARWVESRVLTPPTAWHVALADDARALDASRRLAGALTAAPVDAVAVRSSATDAAARLGDPIAVGLLAALTLGALAAVVLALVGTVSAAVVGVRERAAEFALLQAVGTSMRQITRWLAIEVALVVGVGLVAGGVLGAVMVWAVLPTIALAADGAAAVPAPRVVVPVETLAVAVGAVVVAFASVPLVLSRVVARAHVAEVLRLGEDG